jgi:hypothetical protein
MTINAGRKASYQAAAVRAMRYPRKRFDEAIGNTVGRERYWALSDAIQQIHCVISALSGRFVQ